MADAGSARARLPEPGGPEAERMALAAFARSLYRNRRRRDGLFPPGLFGEPAWDIWLDLFADDAEGREVAVSSACVAAAVPKTTALRYIARLEAIGLVERRPVPGDRRRAIVGLTATGRTRVHAVLRELSLACDAHAADFRRQPRRA